MKFMKITKVHYTENKSHQRTSANPEEQDATPRFLGPVA